MRTANGTGSCRTVPAKPRVTVTAKQRSAASPLSAPLRRAALLTLASAAPTMRGDLTIVLTDDAGIRMLNQRYRGKDAATDVLSFDIGAGLRTHEPFGDVVISLETAKRQARRYGASLEREAQRLLIHGTLHLCGYDHKTRRDAARMHGLTRALLTRLRGSARKRHGR